MTLAQVCVGCVVVCFDGMARLLVLTLVSLGSTLVCASAAKVQGACDAAGRGGDASCPAFWDHTYSLHGEHGRDTYEWYGLGFSDLHRIIAEFVPTSSEVLVARSGDSELSADFVKAGWKVVSIDFSMEVVQKMSRRHADLDFRHMDARRMTFEDDAFDAIFDKGLSDCMSAEVLPGYVEELARVLRPSGVLLIVSIRDLSAADLGLDWKCQGRHLRGPEFLSTSETKPAMPDPSGIQTEYHLLACAKTHAAHD